MAACFLELRVRIPLGAWIFVSCECCLFLGRGLCDRPITRLEEFYRFCVYVIKRKYTLHLQREGTKKGRKKERKKLLGLRVCRTYKHLWSYFRLVEFVNFVSNRIFYFFPGEYQTIVHLAEVHRDKGEFFLLYIYLLPPFSKCMMVTGPAA